jgi:hypothetical protein
MVSGCLLPAQAACQPRRPRSAMRCRCRSRCVGAAAADRRAGAPAGGQPGLRLSGPGEYGTKARRPWRKLHLGVDAGTGRIEAVELTASDVDDGSRVGPLLD